VAFEKQLSLASPRGADEVFQALLVAVQDGPYEIGGVQHERRELVFHRGRSALSWGHVFVALVLPEGTGAELRMRVAGVPGAPRALLDGRKNKAAGDKLLASVRAVLDDPGPPTPAPVESFATMPDGTVVPWTDGDFPGG
jgi:hypothetical protein